MTSSYLPQYIRGLDVVEIEAARQALDDVETSRQNSPQIISRAKLANMPELPNVWTHDKELNVLSYKPEGWGYAYEIDLDDDGLKSAAGELGCIRHIAEKNWAESPCVLSDLIRAFEKFLGNRHD